MNPIDLLAAIPTTTQNNIQFESLIHMGPARANMATVQPVAVPVFPIAPYDADHIAADEDEDDEMQVDVDVDPHPINEENDSLMDDKIAVQAQEVEFNAQSIESIEEKIAYPQMG